MTVTLCEISLTCLYFLIVIFFFPSMFLEQN